MKVDKSKIIAIIQARQTSQRFPNKILAKIKNKYLFEIVIDRLKKSKYLSKIVMAVPNNKNNITLRRALNRKKINFFAGSENDVLDRYYKAAKKFKAKIVVRITGDCPLIDADIVDKMIKSLISRKVDYASNTNPPTFPDGLDVEVFKFDVLKKLWEDTKNKSDREHVTPLIFKRKKPFKTFNLFLKKDHSKQCWTVDQVEDLDNIYEIFKKFNFNINISWKKILNYTKNKTKIYNFKKLNKRNLGGRLGSGQKLWIKANSIIPGGSMLLSKRAEQFLPIFWPSYFSKSSGCYVWDLDGKKYIDFSLMGVGTNILGYANKKVDNAVKKVLRKGNMTTLNCPEEVLLAEKLVKLHPWASMAKFTRSGGEANAVAIRIARAATKRDKVAICGYHGWHDWYIAANLKNKSSLDNHLIEGISTSGVPKKLGNTIFTFKFNDLKRLKKIIKENPDIGAVKMEVCRNERPKNNFLKKVRILTKKNNILLIFDECTSGFRENLGGMHMKYGVFPDLAILGKSLGNGYAINAVIGRKEIMQAANNTFISSTFWTERIGPSAALATLSEMQRTKSWRKINKIGDQIIARWIRLFKKYKIKVKILGIPSLCRFQILDNNENKIVTYITQEMLKRGFLASNSVYVSISHNKKILNNYFKNLESVIKKLKDNILKKGINNLLDQPDKNTMFKRLN